MKSISFTWTSAALRARRKNVTRRQWSEGYARSFQAGEVVAATDRQLRFGGKRIGTLRLTRAPYRESEAQMPDEDYEGEGYAFYDEHPELKPKAWRDINLKEKFEADRMWGEMVWVIRFEILSLEEPQIQV